MGLQRAIMGIAVAGVAVSAIWYWFTTSGGGMSFFAADDRSKIGFEDFSGQAGLDYHGQTWGVAWGDFDGDGNVDLAVSQHFSHPGEQKASLALYRNLGAGRLRDVTDQLLEPPRLDLHGGAWADFDNDADADLLLSTGGASGRVKNEMLDPTGQRLVTNVFMVQENGRFSDRARHYGLGLPRQRGRRPSWYDIDLDGRLDALFAQASPDGPDDILFMQREDTFVPCKGAFPGISPHDSFGTAVLFRGFEDDARYALLVGGKAPGMLFRAKGEAGACGFDAVAEPGRRHRAPVPDFLLADLTGDLRLEFLGPRQAHPPFERQSDPRTLTFGLPGKQPTTTVDVRTAAPVKCSVRPVIGKQGWMNPQNPQIFLGPRGQHPATYQFTLETADETLHGQMDNSDVPEGLFVHYEPQGDFWRIRIKKAKWRNISVNLVSKSPIERLSPPLGSPEDDKGEPVVLLVQDGRGWRDAPDRTGLADFRASCAAVAGGDFDNDMDVDVYLGCADNRGSGTNRVLENREGRFVEITGHGARGGREGLLESVTTADVDNDGFLDLLVTYGGGTVEEQHGPLTLYRNTGNANNWVTLQLEGTKNARDAYGARVFVTAGGITQLRHHSGGFHTTGQDSPLVHFGLAGNDIIEDLIVEWPDGSPERFRDIRVNERHRIVEGRGEKIIAPVILTAKASVRTEDEVHFLALLPALPGTGEVSWTVDGMPAGNGRHSLLYHFGQPGRHEVAVAFRNTGALPVSALRPIEVR